MGTPYENGYRVTTSQADEIVSVPFPGRGVLRKVGIVNEGGGSITADLFNRAFTTSTRDVDTIDDDGSGSKTLVKLLSDLKVKPGDVIEISGTANGTYDTTHRVDRVIDDRSFVLSTTPGGRVERSGTAALAIPSDEQEIYRVTDQITGSGSTVSFPDAICVNQDPQGLHGTGHVKKLYIKLGGSGTYRISLAADLDVAGTG